MTVSVFALFTELRHWSVPGGVLLGAAALWLHLEPDSEILRRAGEGYPHLVYGVAALLGWRLRRSRVVAAVLAVAGLTLLPEAVSDDLRSGLATVFRGAAVPVAWAVLSLLRDRPLSSRRGLASLAAVVLAFGGGSAAVLLRPEATTDLLGRTLPLPGLPWTVAAGWLAPAGSAVWVGGVAAVRRGAVERALLWSFVAVECALVATSLGPAEGIFLLTAGLILGASVVEGSYQLAYRDELTGLPGRRALSHELERLGRRYTAAMVDVDHFKRFNDRHGHEVGDQVLRMVASRLRRSAGGGRPYRYGGEEFTLLFPGVERDEAEPLLEAVRRSVADARFVLRGPGRGRKGSKSREKKGRGRSRKSRTLSVTVSVGAAEPRGPNENPESVLNRADEALYRAKKKGRNRVEW